MKLHEVAKKDKELEEFWADAAIGGAKLLKKGWDAITGSDFDDEEEMKKKGMRKVARRP